MGCWSLTWQRHDFVMSLRICVLILADSCSFFHLGLANCGGSLHQFTTMHSNWLTVIVPGKCSHRIAKYSYLGHVLICTPKRCTLFVSRDEKAVMYSRWTWENCFFLRKIEFKLWQKFQVSSQICLPADMFLLLPRPLQKCILNLQNARTVATRHCQQLLDTFTTILVVKHDG